MAQASYSFLDVAALDEVRQRFAAGDALAILSVDLEEVIWANGPGAALLGQADVETVLGAQAPLGAQAKRQIAATRGFPDIGRDRPLLVRIATGVSSRAEQLLASAVTLPDGEKAILLARPARSGGEHAERAIGGFAEAGHFVAFVDRAGAVDRRQAPARRRRREVGGRGSGCAGGADGAAGASGRGGTGNGAGGPDGRRSSARCRPAGPRGS